MIRKTKAKNKENIAGGTILTNDPSFTAWGYAILTFQGEILETGCISTKPVDKMLRIRKGDDRIRRTSELLTHIKGLINDWNVQLILSELPHGSQNAQAAIMLGIVSGVAQAASVFLDIPIEWYSENDAKKSLDLKKKVISKQDTINAIDRLFTVNWSRVKYKDEAVADALAIYNAALHESAILKYRKNFKILTPISS